MKKCEMEMDTWEEMIQTRDIFTGTVNCLINVFYVVPELSEVE
jgi:hypothetical protein